MLAHWTFDEARGALCADARGHGNRASCAAPAGVARIPYCELTRHPVADSFGLMKNPDALCIPRKDGRLEPGQARLKTLFDANQ